VELLENAGQKAQLIDNLVGALKGMPRVIQERQRGHFHKADPEYGRRVAAGLKLDIDEVMTKAA
jgi:catalase